MTAAGDAPAGDVDSRAGTAACEPSVPPMHGKRTWKQVEEKVAWKEGRGYRVEISPQEAEAVSKSSDPRDKSKSKLIRFFETCREGDKALLIEGLFA